MLMVDECNALEMANGSDPMPSRILAPAAMPAALAPSRNASRRFVAASSRKDPGTSNCSLASGMAKCTGTEGVNGVPSHPPACRLWANLACRRAVSSWIASSNSVRSEPSVSNTRSQASTNCRDLVLLPFSTSEMNDGEYPTSLASAAIVRRRASRSRRISAPRRAVAEPSGSSRRGGRPRPKPPPL